MVLALVAGRNEAAGIDPERLVKGPHNRGFPRVSTSEQQAEHVEAVERSRVSERVKDARAVVAILDRYAGDPVWFSVEDIRELGGVPADAEAAEEKRRKAEKQAYYDEWQVGP
jgi:hypothetical protein